MRVVFAGEAESHHGGPLVQDHGVGVRGRAARALASAAGYLVAVVGLGRVRGDHLEGFDEEETLAGRPRASGTAALDVQHERGPVLRAVLPVTAHEHDGVLARVQGERKAPRELVDELVPEPVQPGSGGGVAEGRGERKGGGRGERNLLKGGKPRREGRGRTLARRTRYGALAYRRRRRRVVHVLRPRARARANTPPTAPGERGEHHDCWPRKNSGRHARGTRRELTSTP